MSTGTIQTPSCPQGLSASVCNTIFSCSGYYFDGKELEDYWDDHNCILYYTIPLNTTASAMTATGAYLQYNPEGQQFIQTNVNNLFKTYQSTNTFTDDTSSSQYSPFQNKISSLCINTTLPGVCEGALTSYCPQYTRQDVINSQINTSLCGCYVPPDPSLLPYSGGCTGGATGCTGNAACDPLCHRAMTSQKANPATGELYTCPQNVCVINNTVIDAQQSNINGGINFTNICAGCTGENGCLCVISGVNISETMGNIGVSDVNFNQLCGSNSVCLVEDGNGNIISSGGCTGISSSNIPVPQRTMIPNMAILFIILILIFIVLFICLMLRLDKPKIKYPASLVEYAPPAKNVYIP